jgi:NTE family protein
MMRKIKNLVFKGGGVRGRAYAGVIEVLEENKLLDDVRSVAGTSAGAITACLLALRYNAKEITSISSAMDFPSFLDKKNYFRILTKFGIYSGDAFLEWMESLIKRNIGHNNATFRDLYDWCGRDLHIFATDLNTNTLKRFSTQQTPEISIAEAVRASMSIPFFFKAWKFSYSLPDDHLYADGGIMYNYPLTAFDQDGKPNPETVGFFLDNLSSPLTNNKLRFNHPIKFTKAVLASLEEAQSINFENDPEELKRSCVIDAMGISATDFNLTENDKRILHQSGRRYTLQFLKNNESEFGLNND